MPISPKHGPNRYERYFEIHFAIMQQWRDKGFVSADAIEVLDFRAFHVMQGEIGCLGRIVISVFKKLDVVGVGTDNQQLIQTSQYSYNARIQNGHNLFRYDNSHKREGHETPHHKHLYDWRTGDQLANSPMCIGNDWPTLHEVIEEAFHWHCENSKYLPQPLVYAENLQSEVTR